MEKEEILTEWNRIIDLIKNKEIQKASDLYKKFDNEEKRVIEAKLGIYQNIEGHQYSGRNLVFLSTFFEPGTFGTFIQWKNKNRNIKKGSKGMQILVPIFEKNGEGLNIDKVKFFKTIYVFAEKDTDLITNKKENV